MEWSARQEVISLSKDPLMDEADLSPGCALGENLENLAEAHTLQEFSEVTDPVPARASQPKSKIDTPRILSTPVRERPRREIKKPARFVNHVESNCGRRATDLVTLPTAGWCSVRAIPSVLSRSGRFARELHLVSSCGYRVAGHTRNFLPRHLCDQTERGWIATRQRLLDVGGMGRFWTPRRPVDRYPRHVVLKPWPLRERLVTPWKLGREYWNSIRVAAPSFLLVGSFCLLDDEPWTVRRHGFERPHLFPNHSRNFPVSKRSE